MKKLEDAQFLWARFDTYKTLEDLRISFKADYEYDGTELAVPKPGLRSVSWKAFLLFGDLDRSTWRIKLERLRQRYALERRRCLRNIENPEEIDGPMDPLSGNANPVWESLRLDEELRREIFQDVERCMPENLYFQQPETQNMLSDILFVWSKLNPRISYRQGMHEVLAPIVWAVERDAIDTVGRQDPTQEPTLLEYVLDANYIGHDAFLLFDRVMASLKSNYEHQRPTRSAIGPPSSSDVAEEAPMIRRCDRIINSYLKKADPELCRHLKEMNLSPQLFLLRWLRLLFGREFHFDHVIGLWDRIFVEDPTLKCVEFICVAMLLRIRWQLLESGYNEILVLLLRYPEPSAQFPAPTLMDDAILLQSRLNVETASDIVEKYTGQRPASEDVPDSPSSRSPTAAGALSGNATPMPFPPKPLQSLGAELESRLQDAAKGVYARGERWGLNKAVRDAVGEVRRNVQGFQSRTHSRQQSSIGSFAEVGGQGSHDALLKRIDGLQSRNKTLATMLEGAVSELWDQQQQAANSKAPDHEQVKAFTAAIGKVQFVQIYLEDSTLPLPESDVRAIMETTLSTEGTARPVIEGRILDEQRTENQNDKRQEATSTAPAKKIPGKTKDYKVTEPDPFEDKEPVQFENAVSKVSQTPQRPPLAQSSFSWMLGQSPGSQLEDPRPSPRRDFAAASLFAEPAARQKKSAFSSTTAKSSYLFGETDDGIFGKTSKPKDRTVTEKEQAFDLADI